MRGFETIRDAARAGIEAAGANPVMVEDFPALDASPRNACLGGVASSDALALIIGSKGGFVAPSKKLVVEEELDEALHRKLPVWVFLQDVERDEQAGDLADRISRYVAGRFRTTFNTADQLAQAICQTVEPFVEGFRVPAASSAVVHELVSQQHDRGDRDPILRIAISPERNGDFESWMQNDQVKPLLEMAHACDLFSYERAATKRTTVDSITIEQHDGRGTELLIDRVKVDERGLVYVESKLTDRGENAMRRSADFFLSRIIPVELMEDRVISALKFAGAFFDRVDPYERHDRFMFSVALAGFDACLIERNPQPRSSMSMPSYRHDGPMVADDAPRVATRRDLREPNAIAARVAERIRRRLDDANMNKGS